MISVISIGNPNSNSGLRDILSDRWLLANVNAMLATR